MQSKFWSFGYYLFILMTMTCAALAWPHIKQQAQPQEKLYQNNHHVTWKQRFLWVILAAIPSSLMLGVTTYITTDIASVPLIWIIPLTLYVGTFILVFARKVWISKASIDIALIVLFCCLIFQLINPSLPTISLIILHFSLLFFCALACHTELSQSRPSADNLTEFYLLMSLGGALGGVFNAIIAPQYFIIPLEYGLALGASLVVCCVAQKQKFPRKINMEVIATLLAMIIAIIIHQNGSSSLYIYVILLIVALAISASNKNLYALLVCICLFIFPPGHPWKEISNLKIIHQDRNFFGIVKVAEKENKERILLHGVTTHGSQYLQEEYRLKPTTYYGPNSGLSDAFDLLDQQNEPQKIAVLGLGIGSIACYKHDDRSYDFFEINPMIVKIAENINYFSYLSDCGSPYKIVLGDARLTIANKPDHLYDMIVMDIFSSDNIPIHTITVEALRTYLKKLRPDGLLTIHISNKYLDLEPVLADAAENIGISAYSRLDAATKDENSLITYAPSVYLTFTNNKSYIKNLEDKGWTLAQKREDVKYWNDQFSNIISALDLKILKKRWYNSATKSK
jgi:spermidine synthase